MTEKPLGITAAALLAMAIVLIAMLTTTDERAADSTIAPADSHGPQEPGLRADKAIDSHPRLSGQRLDEKLAEQTLIGPYHLEDEEQVVFQRAIRELELRLLELESNNISISNPSENRHIITVAKVPDQYRARLVAELKEQFTSFESVRSGGVSVERLMVAAERLFRDDLGSRNFGEIGRTIELTLIPPADEDSDTSFDYTIRYNGEIRTGNYLLPDQTIPLFLGPYVRAVLGG